MKKQKTIVHKIMLFTVLFIAVIGFSMTPGFSDDEAVGEIPAVNVRGKVTKVLEYRQDDIDYSGGSISNSVQVLEVKIITDGPYKDKVIVTEYGLNISLGQNEENIRLKAGDEVLLVLELDEKGEIAQSFIYSVVRDKYLLLLLVIFGFIILSIGRLKGLKALISLTLTILAIIYILVPLILKGFDPVFASIWVCIVITGITLLLVSGYNRKTLAAVIGTTGGVVAAGFLAQIVGGLAKLTGLGNEESQMLMYIPQNISFNYKGLLFAGILIGALGAAMDVAMSLSSAMFEIKDINPEIRKGAHIKAGMNIGRDMIATMSNTLILAYAGGALQLLILLVAYQIPFYEIINQDGYASEVVRSFAGSIGLILTIPITAMAAGFLSEKKEKHDYNRYYR
ncbi:MAG TPA: YibE/F family protein [Clostridiaceae bacterium]|nr:YibE/F family protein [Clostridiaceae bacterium]